MSKAGCDHFSADVIMLIDRMRMEYEMSYAEIIGCLEIIKASMVNEAVEQAE